MNCPQCSAGMNLLSIVSFEVLGAWQIVAVCPECVDIHALELTVDAHVEITPHDDKEE